MKNLPIEISGDIENYSDEFGNQIIGTIRNKGKIVFKGYNAKIYVDNTEIGSDSLLVVESDVALWLGNNVHFDNHCEITLGENSNSEIGDNVWFNAYMVIYNWKAGRLQIGSGSRFGRFNLIAVYPEDKIRLGEKCLTARNVSILSNDGHPIYDISTGEIINIKKASCVNIENHVWIGNGVTLIAEVSIGRNCMVGANSFIRNRNFSNNCIIAGNPAKLIRKDITWNCSVESMEMLEKEFIAYTE